MAELFTTEQMCPSCHSTNSVKATERWQIRQTAGCKSLYLDYTRNEHHKSINIEKHFNNNKKFIFHSVSSQADKDHSLKITVEYNAKAQAVNITQFVHR